MMKNKGVVNKGDSSLSQKITDSNCICQRINCALYFFLNVPFFFLSLSMSFCCFYLSLLSTTFLTKVIIFEIALLFVSVTLTGKNFGKIIRKR